MRQLLAKEKWAEQTLSLPGLTVVIPTKNATLFGVGWLLCSENQAWFIRLLDRGSNALRQTSARIYTDSCFLSG